MIFYRFINFWIFNQMSQQSNCPTVRKALTQIKNKSANVTHLHYVLFLDSAFVRKLSCIYAIVSCLLFVLLYKLSVNVFSVDWRTGQPSNSANEDCAGMITSYDFQWADYSCTSSFGAICEIRLGVVLYVCKTVVFLNQRIHSIADVRVQRKRHSLIFELRVLHVL